jgi:hypothetical protein
MSSGRTNSGLETPSSPQAIDGTIRATLRSTILHSRVACLRYLRCERQQSPRAAADAEHAAAKAALLRLRIEEKQRKLVQRDAHEAMIDQMAGLVLTKLSAWPARIAGQDLGLRRRAEAVLRELRTEIAEACTKLADEQGEPHE